MPENIKIETVVSQEADMELENIAQRLRISKAKLLNAIITEYLDGSDPGGVR